MSRMIMGAFDTPEQADQAIAELEVHGYTPGEISVISKSEHYAEHHPSNVGYNATVGATTGGALGGIVGLLAGIGMVPVLTGLFIAGPISTLLGVAGVAVTGAFTGAAAGGLIGALTALGMPRQQAEKYQKAVEQGGVLLGLQTEASHEDSATAEQILGQAGATDVSLLAVPVGDLEPYQADELIEDPQEYLVRSHQPVFGETLDADYYDGDHF